MSLACLASAAANVNAKQVWLLKGDVMRLPATLALYSVLLVTIYPATSFGADVELSFGLGGSLNNDQTVTLKMDQGDDVELGSVNFASKPFKAPLYYTLRAAYWQEQSAWELELIHQKLYAKSSDLPPRVSHFEITDGYNLLYTNYALELKPLWITRVGVGLVIPHPDITVDDKRTHGGYQLGGISAQLGLEREMPISRWLTFSLEGKVTYAYARIDFDQGYAYVPNTALHLVGQFKFKL